MAHHIHRMFMIYPPEIGWLNERRGEPYGVSVCRTMAREVATDADQEDLSLAAQRHAMGTRLIDLLTHGAPITLGRSTDAEFFELDCGLASRRAYEVINFAHGTTAEEGIAFGYSRCLVGLEIAAFLKVKSLTDLSERELNHRNEKGIVEKVRFSKATTVAKLERVLAQLVAGDAPPAVAPIEPPTKTAERRRRLYTNVVTKHAAEGQPLANCHMKVRMRDGEPRVVHDALSTTEQFEAAERLYRELKKIR